MNTLELYVRLLYINDYQHNGLIWLPVLCRLQENH